MKSLNELQAGLPKNVSDSINKTVYNYTYYKYGYANIPMNEVETLVLNIVKVLLKDQVNEEIFIYELRKRLDFGIKNYISRALASKNVNILNNLLIKLFNNYHKSYRFILAIFLYELNNLGIKFDSNLYYLLKKKSTKFKQLLEYLGVWDLAYSEFSKYLKENKESFNNENSGQEAIFTNVQAGILYSFFEESIFITNLEKRVIVKYFLNNLPLSKQILVIKFIEDSLCERDKIEALQIIEGLKAMYATFLETGEYLGENPNVDKIYNSILMRKQELLFDNEENPYLNMAYRRMSLKLRKNFIKKIRVLEIYYLEKGYTALEYKEKLESAIMQLESVLDSTGEEYISMLLDILYTDLNNSRRV